MDRDPVGAGLGSHAPSHGPTPLQGPAHQLPLLAGPEEILRRAGGTGRSLGSVKLSPRHGSVYKLLQ